MRCTLAFLLALLAAPAAAQDRPPQGIGFAQAEEGTWLCRHEQPEEALACARELCSEQAPGQDCWPTAWCFPANWSGLMTVWLEDFHTTHVLCGVPSEAALMQGLAAICAGDEAAVSCEITLVIDPDGVEQPVEDQSFAGPAAADQPEANDAVDAPEGSQQESDATRRDGESDESPLGGSEGPSLEGEAEEGAGEAGQSPATDDGAEESPIPGG